MAATTWNHETDIATLIGRKAQFETYEGQTLVGTITSVEGTRPVITFDDGRWAYGDDTNLMLV